MLAHRFTLLTPEQQALALAAGAARDVARAAYCDAVYSDDTH